MTVKVTIDKIKVVFHTQILGVTIRQNVINYYYWYYARIMAIFYRFSKIVEIFFRVQTPEVGFGVTPCTRSGESRRSISGIGRNS